MCEQNRGYNDWQIFKKLNWGPNTTLAIKEFLYLLTTLQLKVFKPFQRG